MKLDSLAARIKELESAGGYEVLSDGRRFRPIHSGIHLLRNEIKLHRDLGREPILSDFPEEEREEWRNYAKWDPDPSKHGQISILVSRTAKEILARSPNS